MVAVHSRVFLTIGAWLLGVTAATVGSLIAVSLIGQSIAGPARQQLTASGVSRALAADDHGTDAPPAASPAQAGRPAATAPPSPPPGAAAPAGTLLSSAGGSVVAACRPAGAYLLSWSPQSGYTADDVVRGPAAMAQVVFDTGSQGVSMAVSCTGSVPSAAVTAVAGDDDGGGGGKGGGGGPGKGGGPGGDG
jgi:hypothetical protein